MNDRTCVAFLRWALPQLHLRWKGFRRVRRQVCRRIDKRIAELALPSIQSYQAHLEQDPHEWHILDRLCRVTISRFYRDAAVFEYLISDILPALVHDLMECGCRTIRVWCAGCASGEEPYTLALLWYYVLRPGYPSLRMEITATDVDPVVINRAQQGCYTINSLRILPAELRDRAFSRDGENYCLKDAVKKYVRFFLQDMREETPPGTFHLIFCRNLALTYFDRELRQTVLLALHSALEESGILITGKHEAISVDDETGFVPLHRHLPVYGKRGKMYPANIR